jgi:RNA-directed DNA polymerase
MNKTIDATALPLPKPILSWKAISWDKVLEGVRRFQVRIAKAWKEGRFRMGKTLQRLLQKSFYAKILAIKRVTSNRGSKTPGVDKVVWKTPATKMKVANQLGIGKYTPQPLRRIYIPKKNGKKRALGIPTMADRWHQAIHLLTLEPISESTGDKNSYGFRPCRYTADAIEQTFKALRREQSAQYILEGDIKACFDEISHEFLLKHIPMDKTVLKKMLKAGFMEKNVFHETDAGTPAGGIISPTLANMALDGIEKRLQEHFANRLSKHRMHFIRYADDFVITADSKELLENEVKPLLVAFLSERGLRLSEEKTIITHIKKGFYFLGQTIRKLKDKLIIKPSDKSVKAILDKIRDLCRRNKQAKTCDLIRLLNPVIRGWANFHRHVVSSATFNKVDCDI